MNEGGGLVAFDISGNKNDGTLTNGPTWGGGQFGPTLVFDAVNDLVAVTQSPSLNNLASFTLLAWVYPRSFPALPERVIDKRNANVDGAFIWYLDNDLSFEAHRWQTTNGAWGTVAGTIALNAWTHIATSYDYSSTANDPQVYINGVLTSTTESSTPAGTLASETETLNIGNRNAADRPFNGFIDEVRVYNRALSAQEIAWLFSDPFAEFRTVRVFQAVTVEFPWMQQPAFVPDRIEVVSYG